MQLLHGGVSDNFNFKRNKPAFWGSLSKQAQLATARSHHQRRMDTEERKTKEENRVRIEAGRVGRKDGGEM